MESHPAPPPELEPRDAQHLRLLAIGHVVLAGFCCAGLLFVVGHWYVMSAAVEFFDRIKPPNIDNSPSAFFETLQLLYPLFGAPMALLLLGNLLSAHFIGLRQHRTFSMVVAVCNLSQAPFGTALGVCTLLVLVRPGVRAVYAFGAPPA